MLSEQNCFGLFDDFLGINSIYKVLDSRNAGAADAASLMKSHEESTYDVGAGKDPGYRPFAWKISLNTQLQLAILA